MTFPLILSPEARHDIDNAVDWYKNRSEGLARAFLFQVETALKRIASMPEGPALIYRDVRKVPVARFPYLLFYRLEPHRVVVLAVSHNKRDPRHWQRRV